MFIYIYVYIYIYTYIYSYLFINIFHIIVHCAILFFVTGLVPIIAASLSTMALLLIVALGVYCAKKHKTSKGMNSLCCVLNNVKYNVAPTLRSNPIMKFNAVQSLGGHSGIG